MWQRLVGSLNCQVSFAQEPYQKTGFQNRISSPQETMNLGRLLIVANPGSFCSSYSASWHLQRPIVFICMYVAVHGHICMRVDTLSLSLSRFLFLSLSLTNTYTHTDTHTHTSTHTHMTYMCVHACVCWCMCACMCSCTCAIACVCVCVFLCVCCILAIACYFCCDDSVLTALCCSIGVH